MRQESAAVGDTIQEFIRRLLEENERLETENQQVALRNLECQRRLEVGEVEGQDRDGVVGGWAKEITEYEVRIGRMRNEEAHIVRREKMFERDNIDLIEYVKWISGDLSMLRDRARVAEKVISDLKKSGEESVDSLMETLGSNKRRQDDLDSQVDQLRGVIEMREAEISRKEEDINGLKRLIELETNEKEIEIRRVKTEIDEQNKVIENQ